MKQPDGFITGGPEQVCKLMKSLYSLKQAGRMWHQKLDKELTSMGFSLVHSDNSIWVYIKEGIRIIIPVFMDDMTIAAKDKSSINWVKDELKKRFKLRDLGPTSYLLAVSITRDRSQKSISLSQRHYILDILARYNFADCSPVQTPMDPGLKLTSDMCPHVRATLH